MKSSNNKSDQAPTRLDLDTSKFRAWRNETNFEKIQECFTNHFKGAKSIVNIDKDGLQIKCHLHPDEPLQQFTWKSFFRLVQRVSTTFKCLACRRQALLQMSSEDYKKRLLKLDTGLELIEDELQTDKVDSKRAYRHRCLGNDEHPEVVAPPYEVLFKNKRCSFCNPSTTYSKDYAFVKQFVEMDSDRQKSHGGTFRLLTSKTAFTKELKEQGGDLKRCRLDIRQLNCANHKKFTTTWLDFNYRQRGCTECSKDYNVSYAHRYFEALLNAFNIHFIAEYPVPVNGQSLRVDFYLPRLDQYVEVDSILHKQRSTLTDKNKGAFQAYQERDQRKDKVLGDKLLRIPLYSRIMKGKYKEDPIQVQLETVRRFFKKIYRRTYNKVLTDEQLTEHQNKKYFFKNARVQAQINKLNLHQGKHITFKDPQDHLKVLSNVEQEFNCNYTKEAFVANKGSVLNNKFFLCPRCVHNAKANPKFKFKVDGKAIVLLNELLQQKHESRIRFANPAQPFKDCMVYLTVVPKITIQGIVGDYYIPMHHLQTAPTETLVERALQGSYNYRKLKRPKPAKDRHLTVPIPSIENRGEKNASIELAYEHFVALARTYTKRERNGRFNKLSAKQILALAPNYVHRNKNGAGQAIRTYEFKILPFFKGHSAFRFITPRVKYKNTNTPLLIYHQECSRFFFASWFKLNAQSKLICQGEECFKGYVKETANPPNKHSLKQIKKIISKQYNGAYHPKDLALEYKDMRHPITLIHRATAKEYMASVDNFRRGKFRGPKE
jgi:hypothetical protein